MKKIVLSAIFGGLLSGSAHAQLSESLNVKEFKLSNGLAVWLNEDHSQPKIFGAVVVKAGSKDCPNTGIAHYFEHMMFKGTDKIGTINYSEEKILLDSIAQKYDELALTKDNPAINVINFFFICILSLYVLFRWFYYISFISQMKIYVLYLGIYKIYYN